MRNHLTQARARQSGFSIIELLIAVGIIAIFTTIAIPSLTAVSARTKTKNVAAELYAALSKTRSEALLRNTSITVTAKSGSWQNGWTITNPATTLAAIEDHGALSGVNVVGPASVTFNASGRLPSVAPPTFDVSSSVSSAAAAACISVDLTGRLYMKSASAC